MGWKLIAFSLLSLAASPTDARHVAGETVIIRFRHPAMICAGVCPNYQLKIFDNGEVVRGNPERAPTDRDHIYSNAEVRFHVSPAKLRQFRSQLDTLRPRGNHPLDLACEQAKLPDGSPDPVSTPSPDDIEVRWVDAGHADRLTSCVYSPLRDELQSALRTLGVDPHSGKQLEP